MGASAPIFIWLLLALVLGVVVLWFVVRPMLFRP
jgi:hypothetical protein